MPSFRIGAVVACMAAAGCASPSGPSSQAPAPQTVVAAVTVTSMSATVDTTTTGAVYHASLGLKETSGKSGATISTIAFILQADKGQLTATYTPATPQRVAANGTLDVAANISDASGAPATLATRISAIVNFVDDGGRSGSASGSASITPPKPSAPASAGSTLSGVVTDATSGGILPNISVRVADGGDAGRTAMTDATGRYEIDGLAAGAITLSITAVSYLPTARTVTISGDTRFDIVLPRCPYALSADSQAIGATGGGYSVQVASDAACAWTAIATVPWVTITGGATGSGNGAVAYTAASNIAGERTGAVVVAGRSLAITQAAAPPPAPPPAPTPSPAPTPPPAPAPPPPAPLTIDLTGSWSGAATDSQGPTVVSWVLTQSGSSIGGSVRTNTPTNDGSCGSCHRNKSGTVTGTLSGTSLTLTMSFAAGSGGDPTPLCSSTLTGSAGSVSTSGVVLSYSGADTCEGALANGTMTMHR